MSAPVPIYNFKPGIDTTIYLPINGSTNAYKSFFDIGALGSISLSACFDLYGILWKWSTFEVNSLTGTSGLRSTHTPFPSSWKTVECASEFNKKWTNQGLLSAKMFDPLYAACSGSTITWILCTTNLLHNWSAVQVNKISATRAFDFSLNIKDYGFTKFTTNSYYDTVLSLIVKVPVTCVDPITKASENSILTETVSITSVAPPAVKLYTPNRFVLTGTNINFQNLIHRPELIKSLTADFGNGKSIILSDDNISKNLTTTYNTIGFKTVTIKTELKPLYYVSDIITTEFPNIVQVLPYYDEIYVEDYRTSLTPLSLPYTTCPSVGINDWVTDDNINSCIQKIYSNIEYLNGLGKTYSDTYSDYFGFLGVTSYLDPTQLCPPAWTWEDADCLNSALPIDYIPTWADLLSSVDPLVQSGKFAKNGCATWLYQAGITISDPNCYGRYCLQWNWKSRKSGESLTNVTWADTKNISETYPKVWKNDIGCSDAVVVKGIFCDEGVWNVNIPGLDTYYNTHSAFNVQQKCIYSGIVSKENKLFVTQKTQVKVLSSDYTAVFYDYRNTYNDVIGFSNISNISIDSSGKLFVLDKVLSQIGVYKYDWSTRNWSIITTWGGNGTAATISKFLLPTDIHVDQLDNVWVCDTGNNVIKHYSNAGTWIKTVRDDEFTKYPIISLVVDSQKNVHVLTQKEIRVYDYIGNFLFSYAYTANISLTNTIPVRLASSYNREIIYIAFNNQVLKFFRNGAFAGYIIKPTDGINSISSLYHDEYRNLLITSYDKIYKFPDIMKTKPLKGPLPPSYWNLNDLLIHKEEYIQNWVYSKSFQRLWDNIEIFRDTLHYSTDKCKTYTAPIHDKSKMIIGQNEIVTSVVVNRVLGYLWDNFYTLVKYFDPNCK
jgi:hypothetical protein